MRILHFIETFAPIGGIETYVLDLIKLLATSGYKNYVIYRQQNPATPSLNGRALYLPPDDDERRDRDNLAEILRQKQPSVILLHSLADVTTIRDVSHQIPLAAYLHGFASVCPGLGKFYRRQEEACTRAFGLGCVPMIYVRRCASARHPRSVFQIMRRTQLLKEACHSLDRLLVASGYMRRLMIQNGFEAKKVQILPPHFQTIPSLMPKQKTGTREIAFVGRLEVEKGLPYLLEAMRHTPSDFRLLVAGDGSQRKRYEQMVTGNGLSDRVKFLGWLDKADLDEVYGRAQFLVMTPVMPEPFGKVGIEAMAHGIPVIAFETGGISDWLIDGYNGLFVPPQDVFSLAGKMHQLLDNPKLTSQLGANAHHYVADHYSPVEYQAKITDVLHSLVS